MAWVNVMRESYAASLDRPGVSLPSSRPTRARVRLISEASSRAPPSSSGRSQYRIPRFSSWRTSLSTRYSRSWRAWRRLAAEV